MLVVVALLYYAEPARSLPSFLPGYKSGAERHHHGHALLLLGFAVVAFIGAWQTTGRRLASDA